MSFRRYDHVQRLGHRDVRDIELGEVHVFPKLDGTNGSVWFDDNLQAVCCGSRNRQLSADSDNAGFYAFVNENLGMFREFFRSFPGCTLYGEWLVPHSLKTYQDDAWRRFYVFDVWSPAVERYLPFSSYMPTCEGLGIDYIAPLAVIASPSPAQLDELVNTNDYLVTEGVGEGIVLKNYGWTNEHGNQPWAKVLATTFANTAGRRGVKRLAAEGDIAADIVEKLATPEYIRKEFAKIVTLVANEIGVTPVAELSELMPDGPLYVDYNTFMQTHRHAILPRFMGSLLYDFMSENIHDIVKKWKKPLLDIGRVDRHLKAKAREVMSEVF